MCKLHQAMAYKKVHVPEPGFSHECQLYLGYIFWDVNPWLLKRQVSFSFSFFIRTTSEMCETSIPWMVTL
jgi:hypothetical protein